VRADEQHRDVGPDLFHLLKEIQAVEIDSRIAEDQETEGRLIAHGREDGVIVARLEGRLVAREQLTKSRRDIAGVAGDQDTYIERGPPHKDLRAVRDVVDIVGHRERLYLDEIRPPLLHNGTNRAPAGAGEMPRGRICSPRQCPEQDRWGESTGTTDRLQANIVDDNLAAAIRRRWHPGPQEEDPHLATADELYQVVSA
jgi:hypothetical protein